MRFSRDDHGQICFNQSWDLRLPCRVIIYTEINGDIWWSKCNRQVTNLNIQINFHHIRGESPRQIIVTATGESGFGGSISYCKGGCEPETLNIIKCMMPKLNMFNVYYKSKIFMAGFLPLTQGVASGTRLRIFNIKKKYAEHFGDFGKNTQNGRDGHFFKPSYRENC